MFSEAVEKQLAELERQEREAMEDYIFARNWRGPDSENFYRKDDEFGYALMKLDQAYEWELAEETRKLN